MSVLRGVSVLGIALFIGVAPFAMAQEETGAGSVTVEKAAEEKSEWVWGEVVSVDSGNKQLTIQRLDYNTYEEVQTVLKTDEKTLFENVTDLSQIKPGDYLTVDYKMSGGGNIAGLIVVEKKDNVDKPEVAPAPVAPAEEPASGALEAGTDAVLPAATPSPVETPAAGMGDSSIE